MAEDYSFEAQLKKELGALKHILPCCPNCEHFISLIVRDIWTSDNTLATADEACGLDPERRRPPARIIAFGCPAYAPGIPF